MGAGPALDICGTPPSVFISLRLIHGCGIIIHVIRASPSGKAVGSGPTIRGFESFRPSQISKLPPAGVF